MKKLPDSIVCSDPSVVRDLLIDLRDAWEQSEIKWALLSGWEKLPDYVRHDLDIIVSFASYRRAVKILRDVAIKNEWRLFGVFRENEDYSGFYFTKHIDSLGEDAYVQFDIFKSFRRHNVPVLDLQTPLSCRSKEDNGFWHVPIGWRGAFLVIKELLANGRVDGTHRHTQVKDSLLADRKTFEETILHFGGHKLLIRTMSAIDCGDYQLAELASEYLKSYRFHVLKFPFAFIIGLMRYLLGCVIPFKRLFIAFIGPDGCGKTSIADAVEARFRKRPFAAIWRVKSGFGPLPRVRDALACVKKLLTGSVTEFEEAPKPGTKGAGMVKPHSPGRSVLYVIYYGLNQVLGWLSFLRYSPSLPCLLIADRYYYDYYYQLAYSRCPKWIISLMALIIPKPDMLIVLDRDAKDIYDKKPELDIDEIRREQQIIERYLSDKPMSRIVNARNGLEDTIVQVESLICGWLTDGKDCA